MGKKAYDDDDLHRVAGFMAEHIENEFRTGFQALEAIREDVKKIPKMEQDIHDIKADIKVIKAVLIDTNKDVRGHEKRIARLESTVYHA